VDRITGEQRSQNMRRIRCKNTSPEVIVRNIACQLGFRSRYRLNVGRLPGRPDLVFPKLRKIVMVHGCFWHSHSDRCRLAHVPRSRRGYWDSKLQRNRQRDRANLRLLVRDGWEVLVLWECQLSNEEAVTRRLARFL
jgi:DNA mismatch endonuclease, patch repair protein